MTFICAECANFIATDCYCKMFAKIVKAYKESCGGEGWEAISEWHPVIY